MIYVMCESIVDLYNKVSAAFVVRYLLHFVFCNPLSHTFHDFIAFFTLQVRIVAEVSEGHAHALVLQLRVSDLDVVFRKCDGGREVSAEEGDWLEELNLAVLVPDSNMFHRAQLVVCVSFQPFERGGDAVAANFG